MSETSRKKSRWQIGRVILFDNGVVCRITHINSNKVTIQYLANGRWSSFDNVIYDKCDFDLSKIRWFDSEVEYKAESL
jgi:hypothetical protein